MRLFEEHWKQHSQWIAVAKAIVVELSNGVDRRGGRGRRKGQEEGAGGRGRWKGQVEGAGGRGRWKGQVEGAGGRGRWKGQVEGAGGRRVVRKAGVRRQLPGGE